jgi:hypothetical protein
LKNEKVLKLENSNNELKINDYENIFYDYD